MQLIDYYFTSASPFTYLGDAAVRAVAARHGAQLRVRPLRLAGLWAASGGVPPAERPPLRQAYRIIELKRIAERRGLPLQVRPRFWPTNPQLADLAVAALVLAGHDPAPFMSQVFAGLWAKDENIADPEQLGAYLHASGMDGAAVLAGAGRAEAAAMLEANTQAAIAAGLPGVPGYVLRGEPFWGQDRIGDLEHALGSGRAPFDAA